jgi:hypothetical protein
MLFPCVSFTGDKVTPQPVQSSGANLILKNKLVEPENSQVANNNSPYNSSVNTYKDKELVVVSKSPEFFSYILPSISILLAIVTLLVGVITGVGVAIVTKVYRERKKLEDIRGSFEKEKEKSLDSLKSEYDKMTQALERTAFRLASFHVSKRDLRNLLSTQTPSPKDSYMLIEKTIKYPDVECLELYAHALKLFENDINIIRLVRNGLIQFSRSPDKI